MYTRGLFGGTGGGTPRPAPDARRVVPGDGLTLSDMRVPEGVVNTVGEPGWFDNTVVPPELITFTRCVLNSAGFSAGTGRSVDTLRPPAGDTVCLMAELTPATPLFMGNFTTPPPTAGFDTALGV
ncbi:hypothetical protein NP493_7322g00001 [Ridgeia piscesae]|uniref:Uncharacterized protein n=1 Tax=Ridgeia piscesae TaxID=27915 RepID=A0AAD9IPV0_RIDPI|nr:hypothetical protein NP493_7322g00001 [Ridgeia piscesae]